MWNGRSILLYSFSGWTDLSWSIDLLQASENVTLLPELCFRQVNLESALYKLCQWMWVVSLIFWGMWIDLWMNNCKQSMCFSVKPSEINHKHSRTQHLLPRISRTALSDTTLQHCGLCIVGYQWTCCCSNVYPSWSMHLKHSQFNNHNYNGSLYGAVMRA